MCWTVSLPAWIDPETLRGERTLSKPRAASPPVSHLFWPGNLLKPSSVCGTGPAGLWGPGIKSVLGGRQNRISGHCLNSLLAQGDSSATWLPIPLHVCCGGSWEGGRGDHHQDPVTTSPSRQSTSVLKVTNSPWVSSVISLDGVEGPITLKSVWVC